MRRNLPLILMLIFLYSSALSSVSLPSFSEAEPLSEHENKTRRASMVEHIAYMGVRDSRVLTAMGRVERHLFVPDNVKRYAYADTPLVIGEGQTISQPYIVAFMTEALGLAPGDKVLEVGTGSGYQAAVLAEIVRAVYTIEIVKPLGERAESLLKKLNYKNVFVKIGDGYQGWPEHAPFDAIIITAAPPIIPELLLEQLKTGGRMILPLGERSQELVLLTKTKTGVERKTLLPVIFVPMTGEVQKKRETQ